jgi:hypothetical protein
MGIKTPQEIQKEELVVGRAYNLGLASDAYLYIGIREGNHELIPAVGPTDLTKWGKSDIFAHLIPEEAFHYVYRGKVASDDSELRVYKIGTENYQRSMNHLEDFLKAVRTL